MTERVYGVDDYDAIREHMMRIKAGRDLPAVADKDAAWKAGLPAPPTIPPTPPAEEHKEDTGC